MKAIFKFIWKLIKIAFKILIFPIVVANWFCEKGGTHDWRNGK